MKNSDEHTNDKEVLKMAVLARRVKAAFVVKPEKLADFKAARGTKTLSEIKQEAKKNKNITINVRVPKDSEDEQ